MEAEQGEGETGPREKEKGSNELKMNIRGLQDKECVLICEKKNYKKRLRKCMEGEQGEGETGPTEKSEGK